MRFARIIPAFVLALAVARPLPVRAATFRPPSVPLVTHDPYFSVWSNADRLTDVPTAHWTGQSQRLTSLIRVDGKTYRLMGDAPADLPAMPQVDLVVRPTRSVYRFAGSGLSVSLTFTSPLLPDNLDILSRPVTYLTWMAKSTDGRPHRISIYYDNTAELVTNADDQPVRWNRTGSGALRVLKMGRVDQPMLAQRGDRVRINWGYQYVAAPAVGNPATAIAAADLCRARFTRNGAVPSTTDAQMPRAVKDGAPVMAVAFDLGTVGAKPVSRWLMLAYDEVYAIRYFARDLRPYWRRKGMDAAGLLRAAARDYPSLSARCEAFDRQFTADMERVGGPKYAAAGALAFRQGFAGCGLAADANGQPMLFPKENSSNGCIGTVDVLYPMAPQVLLFGPSLTKAMLVPVMEYAKSPRWKFPFAPHDLGTYPQATGQVYGGGERTEENQMPVEETGNMLILLAALSRMEGNANFADHYWPTLTKWAQYLKDKGFDPENQLCTDDFAGHLAHNVNLSAKAIVALGAYAKLCAMHGDRASATSYMALARDFAGRWVKESADADHYRLAFDKPGTWSQKYNLVWDRILGLDLFPQAAKSAEVAFYRNNQMNPMGVPLDNRRAWAKTDWSTWTATLTGNRADFEAIFDPVYRFLNETPDRAPFVDWYRTDSGRAEGFRARPVVGAHYLPMLYDGALWRKWAGRDQTRASGWAGLPLPPKTIALVPTSETAPETWRYTTERPEAGWEKPGYNDAMWTEGPGGFGTAGTPGAVARTEWNTSDIWLRREVNVPTGAWKDVYLRLHHDEDANVFINGVPALTASGFTGNYELSPITAQGRAALHPGRNLIAVHCHQTTGGQYIDLGLEAVPAKRTAAK